MDTQLSPFKAETLKFYKLLFFFSNCISMVLAKISSSISASHFTLSPYIDLGSVHSYSKWHLSGQPLLIITFQGNKISRRNEGYVRRWCGNSPIWMPSTERLQPLKLASWTASPSEVLSGFGLWISVSASFLTQLPLTSYPAALRMPYPSHFILGWY